ncbi:MAG: hypothetical protein M1817_005591 [Caeruleum heppii]|nr:MAG: hypothetical protein M1817_005591 [Caeruleum heppii]
MASSRPFAIIAGVGSGTGSALARRFAQSYAVVLLARNPANYTPIVDEINSAGGRAVGISTDTASETSVKDAFGRIEREFGKDGGACAAAVYNVGGSFVRKGLLELTLAEFESGWAVSGRGAFNFSHSVLPLLLASKTRNLPHPPTLIFTGATASLKANPTTSAFATGKWALRALSQSLAKEFGPQSVHVSHAIIDGMIDVPKSKDIVPGNGAEDAKISPEAIADAYWHLHTQPRTCFTWEMDIRPYVEKW